jgi:transposase-like protein
VPTADTSSNDPHPICPTCDVPMCLMEVGYSNEDEGHQIYQCKVCDTKLIVPFVVASNSNSIERQNCS